MANDAAAAIPAEAATSGAAHETHDHPNYMAVFWALLVLTVVEVAVPYVWHTGAIKIIMLGGLGAAKAGLVGWYFMHLKFELPNLKLIVCVPLVFATILALGVIWDAGALYAKMQAAIGG